MSKQQRIDDTARAVMMAYLSKVDIPKDVVASRAYDYAEALEAERDKRLKHKGCSTCFHWKEPFMKCQYCGGENEMWEAKDDD